jgi:hypothetical protein
MNKEDLEDFLEIVEMVCKRKGMYGIKTTQEMVTYFLGWITGRFWSRDGYSERRDFHDAFQHFISKKTNIPKNVHWGASIGMTFDEETVFEIFPALVREFVEKELDDIEQ